MCLSVSTELFYIPKNFHFSRQFIKFKRQTSLTSVKPPFSLSLSSTAPFKAGSVIWTFSTQNLGYSCLHSLFFVFYILPSCCNSSDCPQVRLLVIQTSDAAEVVVVLQRALRRQTSKKAGNTRNLHQCLLAHSL